MLFNSHIFIFLFLPLVWIGFTIASRFKFTKIAIVMLVLASFVFYGYWNPPYLGLLLFSILFNFAFTRLVMARFRPRRWPLAVGVFINLGLLCYFKYTNFLLDNLDALLGLDYQIPGLILPLGISFFTFQQISYLVDFHRKVTDEHSFWHYALFVSFFPQLIAGPIVHHKEMMPQFRDKRTHRINPENISIGTMVFCIGLFKKVVIADSLSPYAIELFDGSLPPALADAWFGTICYTLQIYFDFSGYSDMAIGLGRLFNLKIPINFNAPYKSRNIVEFWRRWHITLSRFLKDYLYVPLGGNRKGRARRYVNLMTTMLLGGLWHGANWTFVLWGGLHGLLLCINHGWETIEKKTGFKLPLPIAWLLTFISLCLAWVLFRAPSIDRAADIYQGMLGLNGLGNWSLWNPIYAKSLFPFAFDDRVILCLAGILTVILCKPTCELMASPKRNNSWLAPITAGISFAVSLLFMTRVSEFLYFQF